jgi:hypothetical protein
VRSNKPLLMEWLGARLSMCTTTGMQVCSMLYVGSLLNMTTTLQMCF